MPWVRGWSIFICLEIPDFLTDEECDHIIKRAKDPNEGGMFSSKAKGGLTPPPVYKILGSKYDHQRRISSGQTLAQSQL